MKGSTLVSGPDAANPSKKAAASRERTWEGLTRDDLVAAYRTMLLSRRLDDKEIQLKNQSLIFFQISGAGHEAILTAAGRHLRAGYDWFYPYYRDRALCLALGMTSLEMLLAAVGAQDDPMSGGRQMPSHWGHRKLNIPSQGSPTGTQCLQAIGCAEAAFMYDRIKDIADRTSKFKSDEDHLRLDRRGRNERGRVLGIAEHRLHACGAGALSRRGQRLRHLGSGRSADRRRRISKLVESFPHLKVLRCDGTDFLASHKTMGEAVEWVRKERKPALVHAKVIRPYSHSLSDDERLYKTPEEREAESRRDPITRMRTFLVDEGLATRGRHRRDCRRRRSRDCGGDHPRPRRAKAGDRNR